MKPYRLLATPRCPLNEFWITVGLMVAIFSFEFLTPSEFIFGYLYTAPILLASVRLRRRRIAQITVIAIAFTLLNIWVPDPSQIAPVMVVNRLIAGMALLVTGFLCDRNRYYQEAIANQQVRIQANEKLIRLRDDFTATLTHDLKTPLLGAIETLKAFRDSQFGAVSPTQNQVIQTMTRSHQTSLQLLETLLDIYRNGTEGLSLHLSPVDLTSLAEETANTLLDLAASRRVYKDCRENPIPLWVGMRGKAGDHEPAN